MIDLATFHFLTPAWLILLPLIWSVLWALARHYRRQSRWRELCDPKLLDHLITDKSSSNDSHWLVWLLAMMLTLAVLALAGPSWREQSSPLLESVAARVLALDLSRSTLVEDVKPDRFTQAIASARKIISADFAGETGLVVYAGASFVVSPLSRDAQTLLAFLDALTPKTMPLDGNRLDLAIDSSADLLSASIAKSGQILLITSGTNDIDAAVRASANAADLGHRVSVLAIGTQAGGPLKSFNGGLMRDAGGKVILAKTNFSELERIAEVGGGVFARFQAGSAEAVFSQYEGVSLQSLESIDDSIKTPANDGIWLVWLILPLALLLFRRNAFWVVLIALIFPSDHELYAMDWQTLLKNSEQRAFEAFNRGDFSAAIEFSGTTLLQGSAHYRLQQYQQAFDAFDQVDSAVAFYNKGNALAQMQKFPEAVIAYKKALSIEPDFAHAKLNQTLIETYLAQQVEAEKGDSSDAEEGDSAAEALEQASSQSRAGNSDELSENPGDSQAPGFGVGGANRPGQPDLSNDYDGRDPLLESFIMQEASAENLPDPEIVERWIDSLPEASFDLFQRKFLRDYNRQKNQSR